MKKTCIVWFTKDLRLSDNTALYSALQADYDVIPLYIYSPEDDRPWEIGAASKWWLHHSLKRLSEILKEKGSHLIIRKGPVLKVMGEIIKETTAAAVSWHAGVEPRTRKTGEKLKNFLLEHGLLAFCSFDNFLYMPGTVLNGKNEPYQVFTPFYNACLKMPEPRIPRPAPSSLPKVSSSIKSLKVEDLELLPDLNWAKEFASLWKPGEEGAKERLKHFLSSLVEDYSVQRDFPFMDGTSLMSPHLHFGEISAAQVWHAIEKKVSSKGKPYLRQILWREFASHLLYFFPNTDLHPLRNEFENFPWKKNAKLLQSWQKGKTGYPIIDAGMRQLWRLGWMHNRVRMIVGSFLVKDLMIPWQEGEKWFWDTLVDADLANNCFGWQWVGGCGADAAPYFRIFNPITQSEKFDPEGIYIKAFLPELKNLPSEWVHKPWLAPKGVLEKAGVILGKTYPHPIVDHEEARKKALEYFHQWSKKKAS